MRSMTALGVSTGATVPDIGPPKAEIYLTAIFLLGISVYHTGGVVVTNAAKIAVGPLAASGGDQLISAGQPLLADRPARRPKKLPSPSEMPLA